MIQKSAEKSSLSKKESLFHQKRSSKNTKKNRVLKTNPLAADNQNEIIFWDNLYFRKIIVLLHPLYWGWNV